MSENKKDKDIPVLSPAAVKDTLGDELFFLVAFNQKGEAFPFRPKEVKAKTLDTKKEPIPTTEIRSIDPAVLVGYQGSHKCVWVFGGVEYEFTHPH